MSHRVMSHRVVIVRRPCNSFLVVSHRIMSHRVVIARSLFQSKQHILIASSPHSVPIKTMGSDNGDADELSSLLDDGDMGVFLVMIMIGLVIVCWLCHTAQCPTALS
jgi:hypothetical protein